MEEAAKRLEAGVPSCAISSRSSCSRAGDPRDELPPPLLRTDIMDMKDLKPGMELRGHWSAM